MSYFVGLTPVVRIVIVNRFSDAVYPRGSTMAAVLDTGYEGFLAVPEDVYLSLGFGEGVSSTREGVLADGKEVEIRSALASAEVHGTGTRCQGPVDTWHGLNEVLAGTQFLRWFNASLDYCSGVLRLVPCG